MQEQAQQLAGAVAVFKLDAQAKVAMAAKLEVRKAPAVERRGPNRQKNVTRLPASGAKPAGTARTGTDDESVES